MFNIPFWFCCLNPVERSVLRGCIASYELTLGVFIPCTVFDTLWLIASRSREARKSAFVELYGLTETELELVPGEPLVCVYTFNNPAFWLALVAYTILPSGACLSGCDRWYPS